MADQRRAQTMNVSGGTYAKVAERLKLFREDHPKSKQESGYETDVDGSIVFTVWLWKDKSELIELMKAGVIDKDALRSSADANGNARSSRIVAKPGANGTTAAVKEKEFEKLESIALGRALAMLGYLASGEIASSEEMEEFERFKHDQAEAAAADFIKELNKATTNLELNKLLAGNSAMMKNRLVIEAAKVKQAEFAEAAKAKKGTVDDATHSTQTEHR